MCDLRRPLLCDTFYNVDYTRYFKSQAVSICGDTSLFRVSLSEGLNCVEAYVLFKTKGSQIQNLFWINETDPRANPRYIQRRN